MPENLTITITDPALIETLRNAADATKSTIDAFVAATLSMAFEMAAEQGCKLTEGKRAKRG